VTIDLTGADLGVFEAYESKVLALLEKHGGKLEMRVRALDGSCETHLLHFPSAQAFETYLSDPARLAIRGEWERSGARSTAIEVNRLEC
jgi:uncharacterized protein (DUF1330 family)